MTTIRDLDALDRRTLITWRAVNLIGWTTVACIAYVIPRALAEWFDEATSGRISAVIAAPLLFAYAGFSIAILPALVGRLVGEHVYRWPAMLASVAVAAPNLYLLAQAARHDRLGILGFTGIAVFIAAVTARDRWKSRPRALRGGPPG